MKPEDIVCLITRPGCSLKAGDIVNINGQELRIERQEERELED